MNKIFLLVLLCPVRLFAQIPVEAFAGHEQFQHEFFFFKDFDERAKWNLFSMGRFAVDYEDESLNTSFISSQVTYNFNANWGLSGGSIYSEGDFVPILAVSYVYTDPSGQFFLNLFPTWIIREQAEYELFGLLFFTPKINEHLNLFSQLIFGTTVNNRFDEHVFSYQQVRLGLDLIGRFQFGFAIDQNLAGSSLTADDAYSNNIGVFIRTEL